MIKIKLSKVLGQRRITQAELSRMTNIRPATINGMYNELTVHINLEHIDKICCALDCDIDDLLLYEPNDIDELSDD